MHFQNIKPKVSNVTMEVVDRLNGSSGFHQTPKTENDILKIEYGKEHLWIPKYVNIRLIQV